MRKRILCLILTVSAVAMIFTGCSASNTANNSSSSVSKSVESEDRSGKEAESRKEPEILGQIKGIIGNEISISLVEMPENMGRSDSGDVSAEDREAAKAQGGTKGGASGQGRQDAIKLTGESETFIIPVGTPIVSTKRGNDGMERKELQLEDIYEGMVLQVWLKEGGNGEDKIAEKVAVFSD